MLTALRKALDDKGITLRAYASVLGISEKTLWNKINEETAFTYPEVRRTKRDVLPEYDSEYLFSSSVEDRKEVV